MSSTRIAASSRDHDRRTRGNTRFRAGHALLALTSLVALMIVGLAYSGRLAALDWNERERGSADLLDLNSVADSKDLEPVLSHVFTNEDDRRFAARGLAGFLVSRRNSGVDLPNVGVLAGASVPVESVDKARVVDYRERLSRLEAEAGDKTTPAALALLTPRDLSGLKPFVMVRTSADFTRMMLFWGALYFLSFWLVTLLWRLRGVHGDCLLLAGAHLLTAIGFAALISRPDPLRDSLLFVRYVQGVVAGVAVFGLVSLLDFRKAVFLRLSYVPLLGALALSFVLIVFGSGPGGSSAKVNLGPVQPVEAIRLLLALFLAGYFARRWELLRQIDGGVSRDTQPLFRLRVPRLLYVLPVVTGVGVSLLAFFLQKDLGPALFVACVFLAVYAVARNRAGMAVAGFGLLILGFYVGYALNVSTTLAARVEMWRSPWDNAVRGGDQIAHSVWGLATGGMFGTGLGLGDARYVPAGHTDLIVSAIGEELGFAGLLLIAAIYAVVATHGFRVARGAANDYGMFLATAVTMFLIVPGLMMAAGSLGVIPLTGVVTPFLSYGGSAMVANFVGLGILTAIRRQRSPSGVTSPFAQPLRRLQAGLSLAGVALMAILLNVQVLSADELMVKPHLGLQADGGRRYQYNQRIFDVARMIPRGTIYDRNGLPLATSDSAAISRVREQFRTAGMKLNSSCKGGSERCYPLGGATFHLLGDERTRTNWSASNTSYLERDAEDRLRGFNDHSMAVDSTDVSGNPMRVVLRNYGELVPLIRHRYQPDHRVWREFLGRSRDITLTIDARLQARVAKALAAHAGKSATGRGAAVVIDSETGSLLASVSYPFPVLPERGDDPVMRDDQELLDRARYGLYPPGSTFKLVTAAAALRKDPSLSHTTFTCSGLANGRVGANLANWGVVRDDVLETHAHGTIGMHDGLVFSCNAYFAQLAVRVGPEALLETASRVGISVAPSNSVEQLRKTLPQAGYGQGYVVTSPLRMARVAAAVANDGMYPELRVDAEATEATAAEPLLSPEAAELLGRYMRDAVLSGTGRSLRDHPQKIAGKTGTAEVRGAKSHSWFVGFAPYGTPTKKISFAVIVEGAGYGRSAAAPAAAEIVTAAAEAGLIP